jgi:hypothetical protein
MAQWQYAHNSQLGAKNGQIVYLESYDDRLGGLTYNATRPTPCHSLRPENR